MVDRRRLTRVFAAAAILILACGRAEPVLQVGEIAFTTEQVAPLSSEQLASLADLTGFGQAVAGDELDSLAAPLIAHAAERTLQTVVPLFLAAAELGLGEAELRDAYQAAPEWILTVRHLLLLAPAHASGEARTQAWMRAEEARRRAAEGEDFAALVGEYSQEPGAAARGGVLEPGREGSWVAPFWNAALALRPAEISPVVETDYGFHVIRLDAREPVPFNEADRARVLARMIEPQRAAAALARWVADQVEVELNDPAIRAAPAAFETGTTPDTLVVARWATREPIAARGSLTARDLALRRVMVDEEARERLDRAGSDELLRWVEAEALDAAARVVAQRLGAETSPAAKARAARELQTRFARWANAARFRAGMGAEELRANALQAATARDQEARITRLELEPLRPFLWPRYPVSGTAAPSPAAARRSLSSKSERTG